MNFLETIISRRRASVEEAKGILSLTELMSLISGVRPGNAFGDRLRRRPGEPVKVIAEIKRASPSKGTIAAEIEPGEIAKDYAAGGASAISVLTENSYFKGSEKDFQTVRDAVQGMPLLRKDFIVDEYQIYQSVLIGADAILLIVAALDPNTLRQFLHTARECGLGALVEVHAETELDTALSAGADIIGVNNRNLVTFEVSKEASEKLATRIPRDIVSISESGISDLPGLRSAGDLGFHAVLIGEHFMRATDRAAEVRKFAEHGGEGRKK